VENGDMKRWVLVALGGLMALVGAVWTMQGLGYLEGSSMTGESTWAIVGPVVAGLGVALTIVGLQRGRQR
jgi:hypothetical protein